MNPADIRAFVERDWHAVELAKDEYWVDWKRGMTPADALRAGDALRRHALTVRPDWPDAADRAADRAVHLRVAEALGAVVRLGPR